jgi:hypothetical protein
MTPLDWSVDPRDWSRPGVASIVGNIMRNTRTVIPRLLAAGYRFRTP